MSHTDHVLTLGQRIVAAGTVALLTIPLTMGTASAVWVDSGRTCGHGTYVTYSWGVPTRWTYQGTTAHHGAHKHIWSGDRWMNRTIDYRGHLSRGWCADAH